MRVGRFGEGVGDRTGDGGATEAGGCCCFARADACALMCGMASRETGIRYTSSFERRCSGEVLPLDDTLAVFRELPTAEESGFGSCGKYGGMCGG